MYSGMAISTILGLVGLYNWIASIGAIPSIVHGFLILLAFCVVYGLLFYFGKLIRKCVELTLKYKDRL